mmetsp:Transcript_5286/g.15799  ORF Transcript_5286/g.15799 Transcript_5286/m.15799 type:complete len:250 (-) Transcript_5286:226-975(-)
MVWKSAVGIQELAASRVGSQLVEDSAYKEPASTVSSIHKNLDPSQRFVVVIWMIAPSTDEVHKMVRVIRHEILLLGFSSDVLDRSSSTCIVLLCRILEDLSHVTLRRSSIHSEELQPVPIGRQMACCQLNCAVERFVTKDRRHEHGRGRCKTKVHGCRTGGLYCVCRLCEELRSRNARVSSQSYSDLLDILPSLFSDKSRKCSSDLRPVFRRERDRLLRVQVQHHTSDITPVLYLQERLQRRAFRGRLH